jgi:hypothetical protein
MTKTQKTTASDNTVKVQLASLTLDLASAKNEVERITAENKALRTQNVELASVIENDLKADLKLKIRARSQYTDADLEPLTVEQLQQIDETLMKGKGIDNSTVSFKSIRAGDTADHAGRLTVGSLYGKTRKEILESEGEF